MDRLQQWTERQMENLQKQREQEILSLAQSVSEAEEKILSEALKGTRLDEARKMFKYHELQRKN